MTAAFEAAWRRLADIVDRGNANMQRLVDAARLARLP